MDELILNNYAALAVSIMRGVSPEAAFEILEDPYKPLHRKFTEEEKQIIVNEHLNGYGVSEIAVMHGRIPSTIRYVLKTKGVLRRVRN